VWWQLVAAWLYLTPLWAVLTAWLGEDAKAAPVPDAPLESDEGGPWRALFRRDKPPAPESTRTAPRWTPELLRVAMCATGIVFLEALSENMVDLWIPLILLVWAFALAAEVVERGVDAMLARAGQFVKRAVAVVLVFHYVCLAWIFFRAPTFDGALGVLRQLGTAETDHANVVPMLSLALVTGFVCHFFPDRSFRWLRDRFCALPPPAQGFVLAACALVLQQLAHTKIVPFIYFQF
jgi:hypothetical protein